MIRNLFAISLLAIVLGCGSAPVSKESMPAGSRNLVEYEEIQAARTPGWTAWDLISQVRPQFLRSRGAMSLRDAVHITAVVYLDNILYGDLEVLKTIASEPICRIEFINAADATTRFGTDHAGGAILIKTR